VGATDPGAHATVAVTAQPLDGDHHWHLVAASAFPAHADAADEGVAEAGSNDMNRHARQQQSRRVQVSEVVQTRGWTFAPGG
jgi:hypothetical protein